MQVTFCGHDFELAPKAPGGLILKIAEAESAGNLGKAMALTLRMLRRLIAEPDRERWDKFVASDDFDDLDFDDIQKAIQEATAGAAARPTVKSAPSPTGSPDTPPTSRVVRLSPVTNPESSIAGTSQAS